MMRLRNVLGISLAAILVATVGTLPALAGQSVTTTSSSGAPGLSRPQAGGPSTETPARLRHLEGGVTVQRAAAGETVDAVTNLPLGSGDRLWSNDDGRVEIMFEDGTTVWLDGGTTLDFVGLPRPQVSDGSVLRLWGGSVFVRRPDPAAPMSLRLDTPSGSVIFDRPGLFRVDFDDQQLVWLSAYDGAAVLAAGGIEERVWAGHRAVAEPETAPSAPIAFNTAHADDFATWHEQRLAQYATLHRYAADRGYLPANVVAYAADLEPYGSWNYHPTYASWYWKPYATLAWSPYRDGQWAYGYGGWSWVPRTSWGYVTTHYGRWHYTGGTWIWFPGRAWSPASVHWYVGGGYVGWVPLNYYGRPAVSFSAYLGGGSGVSVGVNFDGYRGYGSRYPYYGYYGYGHHYGYYGYGHHYPGYRGCYWCGHYGGGRRSLYHAEAAHYAANRSGSANSVGPIGSASGRGRVINHRGYSSGLANAWTVVPAADFETTSAGRAAVARKALPAALERASNARVSGTMRARRPGDLVPMTTPATIDNGRRQAVPRGTATPISPVRPAAPDVDGATRRAMSRGGAPDAPPATAPNIGGATRRAMTRSAPPVGPRTTAPTVGGATRRAMTRGASPVVPQATAPKVGGATRRAMTRGASPVVPRATAPKVGGATRRAMTRGAAPVVPRATAPKVGGARRRAMTRSASPVVPQATAPKVGGATRRAMTRGAAPVGPRATAPKVGGAGRRVITRGAPPAAPKPSVQVRPARPPAVARPAQRGRPGPAVRPPAPSRSTGSGGRAVRRPVRPKGGS